MNADEIAAGRARWQARYDAARKRDADFTTLYGMPVEPVYGPPRGAAYPGFDRIGWPGEFPYTRGLYPTGYRGRTWTIRQFAGFGNARQTNERYKMILGEGPHTIGPMTSGILRGIEDGWFTGQIAESAFVYQQALEKGDKKIVGVNCHTGTVAKELEILRISHEVELEQRRLLAERKTVRDAARARAAVEAMVAVSRTGENMIPAMLDAVRAEATLGEICDALRAEWGVYREPARF
ncbi:methylmalonyl-CoA mutase family protein [Micromonospora craniellae]|uniref:Methylmalonyl-CoA mutase alpha/beta chain catalytic domain-containing protein n=1 Tax=Micromonospora craniellae TaxID=2294034 RepID=A0A372G5H1_9ACTN|nr:methylmalonyl-CoA mutase family protein [Micromonospora craniellae]QOC90602.1 hypothetical protein ID554_20905 [Micromonospora craniellae]RFS48016.1 hypothetical protein D0Q02_00450 [Micromonospora craniellae]